MALARKLTSREVSRSQWPERCWGKWSPGAQVRTQDLPRNILEFRFSSGIPKTRGRRGTIGQGHTTPACACSAGRPEEGPAQDTCPCLVLLGEGRNVAWEEGTFLCALANHLQTFSGFNLRQSCNSSCFAGHAGLQLRASPAQAVSAPIRRGGGGQWSLSSAPQERPTGATG